MNKLLLLGFAMVLVVILQVCPGSLAQTQKTTTELEHSKTCLIGREQALLKAREVTRARVDRLKAALSAQEHKLDQIDRTLSSVRLAITETDQALRDAK